MLVFRKIPKNSKIVFSSLLVFGIILLIFSWLALFKNRPSADVQPDEIPTPILSVWWLNNDWIEAPNPNGYSLLLKVDCPEVDKPCDPTLAEVEVQHEEGLDDEPNPRSFLGSLELGGIGPSFDSSQSVETTSVPYSTEDGAFLQLDVEEPSSDDEWTFFVTFVEPLLLERSPVAEITTRFPGNMSSVVNP